VCPVTTIGGQSHGAIYDPPPPSTDYTWDLGRQEVNISRATHRWDNTLHIFRDHYWPAGWWFVVVGSHRVVTIPSRPTIGKRTVSFATLCDSLQSKGSGMARIEEVTVSLVDDFDGTEAAETIRFALDGKTFEIDLSKANASELRRSLRPYVDRARGARRSTSNRNGKPTRAKRKSGGRTEGYDRTEVRKWAKSHRIKVAPRGRIANDVVEKWRAAAKK
jgi:Lsr2